MALAEEKADLNASLRQKAPAATHVERCFDVLECRVIDSDSYLELTKDLERDKGVIERRPNHPLVRRVSCICGTA